MKEQDCILLITIDEEQNITKAAQRLFISQPTVTYRVQQIEQEYNIKIINRVGNRFSFTPEGQYLLDYSKKHLIELSKMKDHLKVLKKDSKGTIRIGVSSNFALYKLPPLLKQFLEIHNKVQIKINTGWSSEVFQLLENNEIQIGIITGNYNWIGEKKLLNEDPVTVISKNPIEISDLPYLPMISYQPNNLIRKTQKPTNPLSELVNNWWYHNFKTPPLIIMELDKVETCKEMVRNNLGYSILPKSCLTKDDHFFVYDLKDENNQSIYRKTWLLYSESALELATVSNFINYMKLKMTTD
ncbi:LysR family transcriptional regulator [Sporosarcina sp. FA9]|uniref:LysR family transcriptional regulator n=1 Tax=Sporosarcina sp. FA9 TaxID=3413030 RepID=UPI003F65D0AF